MSEIEQSSEAVPSVQNDAQPAQTEPNVSATSNEKMLPQSEVNKIVSREVRDAREKTRNNVLKELEQNKAQNYSHSPSNMGGMLQMTPDQIKELIAQETHKKLEDIKNTHLENERQERGKIIADNFYQKMELGKEKYADFEDVVGSVDFRTMPEVVLLTVDLDNAEDVVYDILKNPNKAANILTLAGRNESLARKAIKEISDSAKMNHSAKNSPSIPEPLKPISQSTTGSDNGYMTINDLRSQDWLRA